MKFFKLFMGAPIGYCFWNAADKTAAGALTNNSLTLTVNSTLQVGARANVSKTSGKWYWEITMDDYRNSGGNTNFSIGVVVAATSLSTMLIGSTANTAGLYNIVGSSYNGGNGSTSSEVSTVTPATSDVFGILLDCDANTITVRKNNVNLSGVRTLATSVGTPVFPAISMVTYPSEPLKMTANFGASAFVYTVPSGYSPITI